MRILVLNHEYPPVGGGGGRASEDICRALAKRGHEIVVLTSHIKGLPFVEQRDGCKIVRISSLRTQPYRASLISMMVFVLAGLPAGRRLIRDFQPDVIHVHFAVPAGALAWILSWLTKVPYVLTVHLGDVPGGVPEKTAGWFRWIFPFTRRIWHRASVLVAVSEFTRGLALQHYSEEILVIPNGADMNSLKPGSIRVHTPPVIVFAGRFMAQKNPLQVVRTLIELKKLDWRCVMIGDGPLLEDTRRAASESGLAHRFQFPGWIKPEDVLNWFENSDILFMPSLSEGLPVVGVQALAKGLAILASRAGGFVDLVDGDRNGYLIEKQDSPGFLAALQGLLSNRDRLLSFKSASLEKANSFDIGKIAAQYESIFLEVVESRPKKPQ